MRFSFGAVIAPYYRSYFRPPVRGGVNVLHEPVLVVEQDHFGFDMLVADLERQDNNTIAFVALLACILNTYKYIAGHLGGIGLPRHAERRTWSILDMGNLMPRNRPDTLIGTGNGNTFYLQGRKAIIPGGIAWSLFRHVSANNIQRHAT